MTHEEFSTLLASYVEAAIAAYNDDTAISQQSAEDKCGEVLAAFDELAERIAELGTWVSMAEGERNHARAELDRVTAERDKWEKAYGEAGAELITRRADRGIFAAKEKHRQDDYRRTLHDVMECARVAVVAIQSERDEAVVEAGLAGQMWSNAEADCLIYRQQIKAALDYCTGFNRDSHEMGYTVASEVKELLTGFPDLPAPSQQWEKAHELQDRINDMKARIDGVDSGDTIRLPSLAKVVKTGTTVWEPLRSAEVAVLEAAKVRAQVIRDRQEFGSGMDGWIARDYASDRAISAAVASLSGLESTPKAADLAVVEPGTETMLKRYLTSARKFEEDGFDGELLSHDEKAHLWEKACLAGMCAYLLNALHNANPGEATAACTFLIDADQNGEDLSVWVIEQIAKQAACSRCGGLDGTHTVRDCGSELVRPRYPHGESQPMGASPVCLHNNKCVGIPRFGSVMCAEHDDLPAITPPGEVGGPEQTEPGEAVTYLVVAPQIVGSAENWATDYYAPISAAFTDRGVALTAGEAHLGHDDFCIATIRGGKLWAYGPEMRDFGPEDRDSLTEIGRQLAFEVHPDAVDASPVPAAGASEAGQ